MSYTPIANILTPQDAANELAVSLRRVQQYCKSGRLGQKVGGRWLITKDEIEQFKKLPRQPGNPNFKKPA